MTPLPLRKCRPPLESDLVRDILTALRHEPGVLAWRNNTGVLRDATGRAVRYGLGVGSADIVGLVELRTHVCGIDGKVLGYVADAWSGVGRFLAIEVKRPGQKPSADQQRWLDAVQRHGGLCGVATSVDEALRIVRGE